MKKNIIFLFFIIIATSVFAENINFCFIQISDTHLGLINNNIAMEKVIDKINSLQMNVSFVVHTGDIFNSGISDASADNLILLFKKIKVPVYFVPGNNDIDQNKYNESLRKFEKRVSRINFSMEINKVLCIFFHTPYYIKFKDYQDMKEFKWMDKTLFNSQNKPVIIFYHIPNVDEIYSTGAREAFWKKETNDHFSKLINTYNVKALITGHLHRNEFNWVGNVPIFISPSLISENCSGGSFRIYEYNNGKLSYRTVCIE